MLQITVSAEVGRNVRFQNKAVRQGFQKRNIERGQRSRELDDAMFHQCLGEGDVLVEGHLTNAFSSRCENCIR